MPDLSIIKNEKLRNLIKASAKFKALSAFQQQKHLQGMQNLTHEKEEKLCEFFSKENAKESAPLSNEEQLEILNNLYHELVELEEKFSKLLKKDLESNQRKDDDSSMDNLISSLNN